MLGKRVLSALVMAPPALAAIWLGGYAFAALAAVAVVVMVWEWHRMALGGMGATWWIGALAGAGAALAAVDFPAAALALIAAATVAAAATAPGSGERRHLWAAMGVLYAGLPSLALVWLRGDSDLGRITVIWLFLLVWATDIGAYAAGRTIGGPLLMPRVSPKKTWAGLLGGVASAALVGLAMGAAVGHAGLAGLAVASGVLAVVAQAGDLFESWVKRHFGVKDSSNIIPGHGGLLDRVDGLLAAAALVALATWSSGRAVLEWQ
ncbi:phosphatidate cytidylyltransferase [Magnetospirillum sp. UT-4]|uniref:phosphatidate cytidylyltransferase n=1 Tax=Magnetospirillum sp. UT-4 TaxID=2681467 RepID=UPI00137F3B4D|nr:phosphatidate cytidylyltransferase [Magnetospirillum sp. UT-4]CAA7616024.1 Phosphatidate cytidylyltransferase [Magnetospirillum sp. UT-4]